MWRFPSCSPLVVSLHVCMACIHPTVGPAGVRRAVADGAWRSQRGREAGRSRRARVLDIAESASRTTSETLMPTGGIKDAPSPYSKAEELHAAAERKHSQLCSHELEEAPVMAAHDPAAVVKLDSRRRQIHLSHIQRELIWKARRQQYQQLLVRIVVCLESHLSPIEKCHALLSLHEEVIKKRIRLRSDTYEDIFHIFYAVATLGSAAPTLADEEAVDRRGLTSSLSSLLPAEFAGNSVAASSLLAGPLLQSLWTMYRYMIDSGTNPTARTVQYMMGVLERSSKKDAILEARAHSLMMDLDRFHLTPTEYTIAAYVGVCDRNGVMHLAVARVTDYRTRHEKQVSPGIYARLLFGLAHNHQYDEAISCLTTIDSVAVTPYLLNAILHVARHSRSPLSAFTFYKSVIGPKGNNIAPTSHTISILLEAMCASECYDEIDFLLCEMRRHRVKGNNVMLNKLLGVLLKLKRHTEGMALCRAMEKKGIMVFDELRRECEDFSTTPHR
ncbi:putative kinetoplast ribosomal PPR-repeat containing protein 3 [Trypanosoma cruzi]|uniref:Putative kinetoplast ribosomal PPR-repeat containing protein 3 n=1 Tax=Trypanosoma cruzi TaxID=5693 RepID=A0A2V2W4Q3_TRYCR|nr:putative kinetoplast ribosomal PPR-repeat containing protein 3 [Trypanosoma cruzi]